METKELLDLLNSYTKRTSCDYYDDDDDAHVWFEYFKEGRTASGSFKKCLIFENLDYVVKIPFSYTRNKRENECENEIKTYESAKKAGVEKIFLETWFIGFLDNGCPIYGQAKADYTVNSLPDSKAEKYERITKTVTENMRSKVTHGMYDHCVNRLWVEMFISLYGKNFAMKFEKWTRETRLSDFHNGNIGYRKDKPIILDYNYCR